MSRALLLMATLLVIAAGFYINSDDGGKPNSQSAAAADSEATPTHACNGDPTDVPPMPHSTFCQAIPAPPIVAANSAAIISYYATSGEYPQLSDQNCCSGILYQFGATGAPGSPPPSWATRSAVYWARSSDPSYRLNDLGEYTEPTPPPGTAIQIPDGAKPQGYDPSCTPPPPAGMSHGLPIAGWTCTGGGGEGHMAVIDPTHTWEYDFYRVYQIGGGTITSEQVAKFALAQTDGWGCTNGKSACFWGQTTASNRALSQGLVAPRELLNGSINHALTFSGGCSSGEAVLPAYGSDSPCDDKRNALAEGQKVFLAACSSYPNCPSWQSVATIAGWNVPKPSKIVLDALATYGMYLTDTGIKGWYLETFEPHSYLSSNPIKNYWPAVAQKYNLRPYPIGKDGLNLFGYDFAFRNVPDNPKAPPGTSGLWSWMAVCSKSGC